MSWTTGVPNPYHLSQIADTNTGLIAVRQLDLRAINAANCPSNLPAFGSEDRLWAGTAKVGLVWIVFTNSNTDDADPAKTPILADETANRFQDIFPKMYPYDPAGKKYMVVWDPDANNEFTARHCF